MHGGHTSVQASACTLASHLHTPEVQGLLPDLTTNWSKLSMLPKESYFQTVSHLFQAPDIGPPDYNRRTAVQGSKGITSGITEELGIT